MDKATLLQALARKRQHSTWPGYKNIGDYYKGAYECMHVSPYTKSAGNVDSQILIFLQDWSSDEALKNGFDAETAKLGYTPRLPTNRNLVRLLNTHFGRRLEDVFVTNLFPFIKPSHIGQTIPRGDLVRAAQEFGLPQIQAVQPDLVICLGLSTFNGIREACDESPIYPLATAIQSPFLFGGAQIWCQAHTGGRGQAMRNTGTQKVPTDWDRMKSESAI